MDQNSHQQAGLAAGTVTDDDQLPAELGGHCCWVVDLCDVMEEGGFDDAAAG
jgi:hypothetical protein